MIVVTGAAGFIGSNLVAALNAEGRADVVAVDDVEPLRANRQLQGLRIAEKVERDALPAWLEAHATQVDALLHMGANSDTTATDRAFMLRNNTEYTQALWSFCTRRRVRFVYASSAATYGDGSRGYDDECDPHQLQPLNLYGESKHLFDLWALAQTDAPPGWAGLKFFNVYGPREEHKGRMASMVYHGFHQILKTGSVKLFAGEDGREPQRDFIYVKDCVAAVLHCARAQAAHIGGLYNVGTGSARSFQELIAATFRALGREPRIETVPLPADLRGKYQFFTQATTAKLQRTGFTHRPLSVEDGARDYVVNYLQKNAPVQGV